MFCEVSAISGTVLLVAQDSIKACMVVQLAP
jgi:hypothetical protein